jgi:transcription-repair coupling factor (superfamily II helicase)
MKAMLLPFVRELFADVENVAAFERAASHLKTGTGRIRVSGLTPAAKNLVVPLLYRATGRPIVLVVADNRAAEAVLPVLRAFCELTAAAPPHAVVSVPAYDVLPFENLSPHPDIQEQRATALWKISTGAAAIIVAPAAAAAMRLQPAAYYAELARTVRHGESVDLERLTEHLAIVGYAPVDVVEMPGQYAVRGGILDVYPPESDRPVRVEFFGDEVDSLRKFDPASQRSSIAVDEVALLPLTETPVREELLAAIHARLSGSRLVGSDEAIAEAVAAGGVSVFPGWEFYAPVAGAGSHLFDLPGDALVLVDEPADVHAALEHWWDKVEAAHQRSGIGQLVGSEELYLRPEEVRAQVGMRPGGSLELLEIAGGGDVLQMSLLTQPTPRFHGSMAAMAEEVRRLTAAGHRVLFAAPNLGEVERLADILAEYDLPYRLGSRAAVAAAHSEETAYFAQELSTTIIVRAFVPEGVALPDARLVVLGTRDLFDESELVVSRPAARRSKTSAFLSDFRDLQIGDYVVHVEHGIGQYCGLKEIVQGDIRSEFMVLEYAEGARLYVPLTRLDLVQKYRSSEGAKPPLSRLGTAQWAKTKARVKKAIQDMADELLKLYAERRLAEGHAFSPDTQWQREFEDSFAYSETEDQAAAIVDVKRDMEAPQPMDRLLCGDVGYGKTEVAMRAAFKAVNDNKQVAVLAPTTVLAFQHFETFKQRFAAFPVTVELASRFRTTKQQKEILERVGAGKVDILIGTHRLLSRDVKFADLGLVVVDEEQRFGVRHKERLKKLKTQVDVLTMSATPIPRTLHMSLVGLRDMSVIETPPKDRMAIQTVVAGFDDKLVKSAIEHELERGGQIYFVHNRVESIYEIGDKVRQLVPQARLLVAHGQMSEHELERVMLKFIRHEADVLLATTIIENGLDIPLCNTILINRADRHGLSELYQLRGRVGRSDRRAYAYLLIPPDAELTPVARRRLAALKEFSELGAGFKIAALDLELRGAGNMLGAQQSGHVDAVGFELYTSMLERAVRELKGEAAPREVSTQLNLGLNIRIPAGYIAEENQRLRIYKRVAGVETEAQLHDVRDELEDRYGAPPAPVLHLLEYAVLKLQCERVGVASIDRKRDLISIKFQEDAAIDPERLMQFVTAQRGAQFTPGGILKFALSSTRPDDVLDRLKGVLQQLAGEPAISNQQTAIS